MGVIVSEYVGVGDKVMGRFCTPDSIIGVGDSRVIEGSIGSGVRFRNDLDTSPLEQARLAPAVKLAAKKSFFLLMFLFGFDSIDIRVIG